MARRKTTRTRPSRAERELYAAIGRFQSLLRHERQEKARQVEIERRHMRHQQPWVCDWKTYETWRDYK